MESVSYKVKLVIGINVLLCCYAIIMCVDHVFVSGSYSFVYMYKLM